MLYSVLVAVRYCPGTVSVFKFDSAAVHEQSKPVTHIFAILNKNHNFVFAGPKQLHALRCELYDTLVEFFPPCMTQPRQNLIDLIKA